MANKESFLVLYSWEESLSDLTDQQCGVVFRAIFAFEKRGEPYSGDDIAVKMAMKFIQPSLTANKEKYEEACSRNRKNGIKGGRPKKTD